mgnify:FL=1
MNLATATAIECAYWYVLNGGNMAIPDVRTACRALAVERIKAHVEYETQRMSTAGQYVQDARVYAVEAFEELMGRKPDGLEDQALIEEALA